MAAMNNKEAKEENKSHNGNDDQNDKDDINLLSAEDL
jgi:hypothetical protein